ncbi:MAG: PIN domain-containing protein [Burkholderiales bacterium]|nr:PIN domain-containing protein [Burkholderiales bacterium]
MPIRSPTRARQSAEPPAPAYFRAGDLPDLNVWLALSVEAHPHFERARRYWREEAVRAPAIHFCRVTMLGFVRLLTQPKLMGDGALSPKEAFERYLALLALPEVELAPEPPGCEEVLAEYVREPWFAPRLWTDAYLAAFARSAGLRLVTFDRDFARFREIEVLTLV